MFQCLECDAPVGENSWDDDDEFYCPRCGSHDIDLYVEADNPMTVRDIYPAE